MGSTDALFILLSLSFCCGVLSCGNYGPTGETYHGHKIFTFRPETRNQLRALVYQLPMITDGVDFWTRPSSLNQSVDIRVSPWATKVVENFSEKLGFRGTKVVCQDVQKLIDSSCEFKPWGVNSSLESFFDSYHRLAEINSFLEQLVKQYPGRVAIESIGKSFEGRDMKVVRISAPSKTNAAKKIVWIDAGVHAREWIAPSTALYLVHQLLADYDKDPLVKASLDAYDFVILPSMNPDGYEYSHTNSRLWRKTRSTGHSAFCDGVDANRNFDWHWNEFYARASPDLIASPCAEDYPGPKAFSEKETQAVADYLIKNKGKVHVYISLHSYSQLWMYPWGYTSEPSDRDAEFEARAKTAVAAIKKFSGTSYRYGPIYTTVYPVAGDSGDWAYGTAKVPYSFGIELPPKTGGIFGGGFILPASKIVPIGKETSLGLLSMIKDIAENGDL